MRTRVRLPPPPSTPGTVRTKLAVISTTVAVVFALDCWTKLWAVRELAGRPQELFGGLVPLTLAYNRGAAFGISVGNDSRWLFVPVTVIALVVLAVLARQARAGDHLRIWSLAFVIAGAIGNLYDRLRWNRGVVDFIGPLDLGFWHFPIFNVADACITCGATALAISFWREDAKHRRERAEVRGNVAAGGEREACPVHEAGEAAKGPQRGSDRMRVAPTE